MIPDKFNRVDLEGIDVLLSQGVELTGLYSKLNQAISSCRYQILYNWKFDGILIPPTYVHMVTVDGVIYINQLISVTSDDVIHIHSIESPAVINPITITENGTYEAGLGVDGYNPVEVSVNPVLSSLSVVSNGIYLPPSGVSGFYDVTVNVPETESKARSYDIIPNSDYVSSHLGKICGLGPFYTYQGRVNLLASMPLSNKKLFTLPSAIIPDGYYEYINMGNGGTSTKVSCHIDPSDGGLYIDTSITTTYLDFSISWYKGTASHEIIEKPQDVTVTGKISSFENNADMNVLVNASGSNSWRELFTIPSDVGTGFNVPFIYVKSSTRTVIDASISGRTVSAFLSSGSNNLIVKANWKTN